MEDLPKDQGREESGKRIETLTFKRLIKSVMKDRRDEFGVIKKLHKELEKGRGIVKERILTVSKSVF